MLLQSLLLTALAVTPVLGCADHTGRSRGELSPYHLERRQQPTNANAPDTTNSSDPAKDWSYDASYNWGSLKPYFATCQTGTQQSPIALSLTNGLSLYHHPTFVGYNRTVTGNWTNWSYGPAFTLDHPKGDYTSLPVLKWDNVTAYLKGWHIHAPADHSVGGDRSKAEMHLVHVDTTGLETAVLAIRLDPGSSPSSFFTQLPPMIPFVRGLGGSPRTGELPTSGEKPKIVQGVSMDMNLVLDGVDHVSEFWSYKGSLTSPPCREGIRWFVARAIAFTSVQQMRDILGACTYSARQEQEVWLHEINSA
ncbi:MAG: hypothetical protein Q9168_002971 [Polycauliona sp. 1 TL-2023]